MLQQASNRLSRTPPAKVEEEHYPIPKMKTKRPPQAAEGSVLRPAAVSGGQAFQAPYPDQATTRTSVICVGVVTIHEITWVTCQKPCRR